MGKLFVCLLNGNADVLWKNLSALPTGQKYTGKSKKGLLAKGENQFIKVVCSIYFLFVSHCSNWLCINELLCFLRLDLYIVTGMGVYLFLVCPQT